MFLGKYEENGKEYFYIYYKNKYGYKEWYKDTFSPNIENIMVLDLSIHGKNYEEKKACAEELAKDYQYNFACLSWSYGELATICEYFKRIGKRYGLLKEFKENAIC